MVAFARVQNMQSPTLRYATLGPAARLLSGMEQRHLRPRVPPTVRRSGPHSKRSSTGAAELPELSAREPAPVFAREHLRHAPDGDRASGDRSRSMTPSGPTVELWDRVSHLWRLRLACDEKDGYLLVLSTEMGRFDAGGSGLRRPARLDRAASREDRRRRSMTGRSLRAPWRSASR